MTTEQQKIMDKIIPISIITLITTLLFGLIVYGVIAAINDEKQWELYAYNHHCDVKDTIHGGYIYGISGNGQMAYVYTPTKHKYVCNNGESFWR